MSKSIAVGVMVLITSLSCNFDSADKKEETNDVVGEETSITRPDSIVTKPVVSQINYIGQVGDIILRLQELENQLDDSLSHTAAPVEIQEELMLHYKQLAQKAKQQRTELENLRSSDLYTNANLARPVMEAQTTIEDINQLFRETASLY